MYKRQAFDWNRLKKERIIQDRVGDQAILLALAADNASFVAFKRPDTTALFSLQNDTLRMGEKQWDLMWRAIHSGDANLQRILVYE